MQASQVRRLAPLGPVPPQSGKVLTLDCGNEWVLAMMNEAAPPTTAKPSTSGLQGGGRDLTLPREGSQDGHAVADRSLRQVIDGDGCSSKGADRVSCCKSKSKRPTATAAPKQKPIAGLDKASAHSTPSAKNEHKRSLTVQQIGMTSRFGGVTEDFRQSFAQTLEKPGTRDPGMTQVRAGPRRPEVFKCVC